MIEKIAVTIIAISIAYKIAFMVIEGFYKATLSKYKLFRYEMYNESHTWMTVLQCIEGILVILSSISAVYLIVSWLVFFLGV